MPVVKSREYRNLTVLEPKNEKRIESNHYVEGYATTYEPYEMFEMDGVQFYERIDRGAFLNADVSDVIMQYDHSGRVLARQSNGSLLINTDERGLFICADLSKSNASRDLYEDISQGLVNRMSWAFTVAEEEYDKDTRTRIIKRVNKVYDVSAVSIPANDDTLITARSFFNGVIEEEKQELLERRKNILKLKLKLEEQ